MTTFTLQIIYICLIPFILALICYSIFDIKKFKLENTYKNIVFPTHNNFNFLNNLTLLPDNQKRNIPLKLKPTDFIFKYFPKIKAYKSTQTRSFLRFSLSISKIFNFGTSKADAKWVKSFYFLGDTQLIIANKKMFLSHHHQIERLYYSKIQEILLIPKNTLIFKFWDKEPTIKIKFSSVDECIEIANTIYTLIEIFKS